MQQDLVPEALERLDTWVNRMAAAVGTPVRSPLPDGDFIWLFPESDVKVAIVAKSVRLVSALAGAWTLAGSGQTTEAGSLLRLVDDFSAELWFLSEVAISGSPNRAQRKFLEQFFASPARSLDEYIAREREHWVARSDVLKAHRRLGAGSGVDPDRVVELSEFISYGLNGYIHGGYDSAMELYDGSSRRFEVRGHAEGRAKDASRRFIGTKATTACLAVSLAAAALGEHDLGAEVSTFLAEADPDVVSRA